MLGAGEVHWVEVANVMLSEMLEVTVSAIFFELGGCKAQESTAVTSYHFTSNLHVCVRGLPVCNSLSL